MDDGRHPAEAYPAALLVLHVHDTTTWLNCTPDGCRALAWAVEYVTKVAVARIRERVTAILLRGVHSPAGLAAADLRTAATAIGEGR